MSRIDDLIAGLHGADAERLLLVSGKPAVLTVDGDLRQAPGGEIDRDSLEGMVLVMGGTDEPGQHEFTYDAPTGPVRVTARITGRLIQAIIVPARNGASHAAPAAPAPPVEAELGPEPESPSSPPEPVAETEAGDGVLYEPESEGPRETARPVFEMNLPGVTLPEIDEAAGPAPGVETDPQPDLAAASGSGGEFASGYAFGASTLDEADGVAGDVAPDEGVASADGVPPADEGVAAGDERLASEGDGIRLVDPDATVPPSPEVPPAPPAAAPGPDIGGMALEAREDAPAMERLFLKMVRNDCSDLHVSAGSQPLFRKDGHITDLGSEPRLSATQTEALLMGITPEKNRKEFEGRNDTDFAYEMPGVARFRCNLFRDRKGMGGVFRQIPTEILTAEQLGLPSQLLDLCSLKKGLILVTGPTGSGKSTTLAALIDHVNRTRHDHIITIEDPIEFVHENRSCLINQREVGEHTNSFKVALRAALREDPDIVLVGELRDLETVEIALETAETGHLVFGTLHTNTAPGTVSRLIDQFPSGQQSQIRTMLADTLKAVIAQTLCRKIEGGRTAALETLVVTTAVANLIREDKAYQISSAMQTGRAQGMRTLNDALLELIKQKAVSPEEAYANAVDKPEFVNVLSRNGVELDVSASRVA